MATSKSARKIGYSDIPIVTLSLIGLNVLVYAAIASTPAKDHAELYRTYGLTASNPTLFTMFTSCFLHSDLLHLTTNMGFLWLFGRNLERALGVIGYLLLYVCSGIFAAFTHLTIVFAFGPIMQAAADHPSLGASGAIAGILGMYAIRFFRNKLRFLDVEFHPPVLLLIWLILQIFLGVLSLYTNNPHLKSVDYWAHMGGFIFGILVAYYTHMANIGRREYLLTGAEDTFKRGTLLDVVRRYEALLKCDRDDPFVNAELGRTWALLDDREQALPYYQKGIDLLLKTGKNEDAFARYQELTRILPGAVIRAETLYRLAEYVDGANKPSMAVIYLNRISDNPDEREECEIALLKAAEIQLHRMRRPEAATETLLRFLERFPNSRLRLLAEQTLQIAKNTEDPWPD